MYRNDGRVGQWSNGRLRSYFNGTAQRIVASEWEPFPLERLRLKPTTAATAATADAPLELVLATTLRHPLDRLYSTYRFFGLEHNSHPHRPGPHGKVRWGGGAGGQGGHPAISSKRYCNPIITT